MAIVRRLPVWTALAALIVLSAAPASSRPAPVGGATAFQLYGGRIYAEVELIGPDGAAHRTRAFIDLGGTGVSLSPALFRTLGPACTQGLTVRIGGTALSARGQPVTAEAFLPFSVGAEPKVEMVLPAALLKDYQVIIDYRRRQFIVARPGSLRPRGSPTPFVMDEKTGLITVEARVDGRAYPMTLDAGSGYTWLARAAADPWLQDHPPWRHGQGAVGAANMRMADDGVEAAGVLMRLPQIDVGPVRLDQVGALAIGPNAAGWDFMDWYSKKNAAPVIGWLGGNALRPFRLTIDYPNRKIYWLRQDAADPHDLDQVGLTLERQGPRLLVAAVATRDGVPTVEGVRKGDRLLGIDGVTVTGATSGAVLAALHGRPGETRRLEFERDGESFSVAAKVTAF
jgi:hypothetical protein